MTMDASTVATTASAVVNLLVIFTVTSKWARWTGIVDAKLDELNKQIQRLNERPRK